MRIIRSTEVFLLLFAPDTFLAKSAKERKKQMLKVREKNSAQVIMRIYSEFLCSGFTTQEFIHSFFDKIFCVHPELLKNHGILKRFRSIIASVISTQCNLIYVGV